MRKIDIFELKIVQRNIFPINVFQKSKDYIFEALDSFRLHKKWKKKFKFLGHELAAKKSFFYLFWIVFTYKFKASSFS